jgi:hypothetical protein
MALDMVFDALMTAFVTGPGAAVTQVSDGEGHRLYSSDGEHLRRGDLETDPARRLKGVGRWPWFGGAGRRALPGELYFMRRQLGERDLEFTVSGSRYKIMAVAAGSMLEIEVASDRRSLDQVRISKLATARRAVEVRALDRTRTVHLRHVRSAVAGADWKSVEVRNARVGRDGLALSTVGDLMAVELSSKERPVEFDLEVAQRRAGVVTRLPPRRLATISGRALQVAPTSWLDLDRSELQVAQRGLR